MSELRKHTLLPETVASMLQEMGYRGRVLQEPEGTKVESATNGSRFYVNFFSPQDGDPAKGFEEIQFDTGFGLRSGVNTAKLINRCNFFNMEYRFAKVAVWDRGYRHVTLKVDFPVLGNDFLSFERCASLFLYVLQNFIGDILESGACAPDGCSDLHTEAIELLFGPNPDPKSAIELYRKAAEKGYAGSQNNLGDQYEAGTNLPK